jgi:catechol 2,3-dioxygenase-like lactoylglutathione lyase family enzyme
MPAVSVRYIVNDVEAAIEFYRDLLGFTVDMHPAPGFAALSKDDLRLLLNAPGAGGAGQAGGHPEPGGWARFQLTLDDLEATIDRLRERGATFRGELVKGNGGNQILVEDPSGNPVELFQPHPHS